MWRKTNLYSSVSAIIEDLNLRPKTWKQYDDILESWISEYTYCKIYTRDGLFGYILALDWGIYHPTIWERIKLGKAIKRFSKKRAEAILLA